VVIASSTRRLLGNLFEYRDLGAVELKGFAAPVSASQVLHEGAVERRFEASHATGTLSPLIGREAEIALLFDRWQRAKDGAGEVALIAAEPGIGKSRLVTSLCRSGCRPSRRTPGCGTSARRTIPTAHSTLCHAARMRGRVRARGRSGRKAR
jgi:hypothetical protein